MHMRGLLGLGSVVLLGLFAAACTPVAKDDPAGGPEEPGADAGGETPAADAGEPGVTLLPSAKAKQIVAGAIHACALTTEGAVRCWGYAPRGEVGDGRALSPNDTSKAPVPVQVTGLETGVKVISAYADFTCAVTSAGGVKCWGADEIGQLGTGKEYTDNRVQASSLPVDVLGLTSGVVHVSAGTDSACAVMATGKVKCWGHDEYGKLGNDSKKEAGDSQPTRVPPVDVVGLSDAKQVSVGHAHACAVTAAGKLFCWGSNAFDELGIGETNETSKNAPVEVAALGSDVAQVFAGFRATCALLKSGAVKCWGENSEGGLGDGKTGVMYHLTTPTEIGGLAGLTSLSAPSSFTCAAAGGAAKCWGSSTALGFDDPSYRTYKPEGNVAGLAADVVEVTAGTEFACARKASGAVLCWGDNGGAQLGDGTGGKDGTERSDKPVAVKSLP